MKPADLSVTSAAYITHFTFSAFFSLIYSSCKAFAKNQSLALQRSSELASPFCHVIPDHTCLVPQGQRSREAQRHLWAISTGRTDASKAWPHMRERANTGTRWSPRHTLSLQGLRMGSPGPARPQDDDSFHPTQILTAGDTRWWFRNKQPKRPSVHPKAGAQSTRCPNNGCMRPLGQ